jgi:hypothetical protein
LRLSLSFIIPGFHGQPEKKAGRVLLPSALQHPFEWQDPNLRTAIAAFVHIPMLTILMPFHEF